jgi:hypothetical protein
MQQLKAKKDQGKDLGAAASLLDDAPGMRLGQVAEINPAKDGLTPAATALANAPGQADKQSDNPPRTLGETLANEIVRRMGEVTDENGETKDTGALRDQLASTMDWVREKFGDDTAAAAAGMVIQATSSGVNEDTLGNGLLNTLKFIDRNFGTNAGGPARPRRSWPCSSRRPRGSRSSWSRWWTWATPNSAPGGPVNGKFSGWMSASIRFFADPGQKSG